MVLVRLQVHVLPWRDSDLPDGIARPRKEHILPWNEPCDENATIQTLSEHIVARFRSIHVGKGYEMFRLSALLSADWFGFKNSDLNIKYLQDFWGSLLDMTTTVGQTFIDRACGVDISNSIVKVVRYPPTLAELENPLRCASIAPDSSARPRKRGFQEFTDDSQSLFRDSAHRTDHNPRQLLVSQRVSKRSRGHEPSIDDVGNLLPSMRTNESFENLVVQSSSQNSILPQPCSVQVNDSQRSAELNRMLSRPSITASTDLCRTQYFWDPCVVCFTEPARGVV